MPSEYLKDLPPDVRERAAGVRLLGLDVDGTLTDGRLWYGSDGRELKAFSVLDGLGMKALREHGIEVALVTARDSAVVQVRARELGLRHVYQGSRDKLDTVQHLCRALSLQLAQVAFMGDDLPDLGVMAACGFAVAPANAHPWVRQRVHWTTQARGGDGAVRELCDAILLAQRKADAVLHRYLPA